MREQGEISAVHSDPRYTVSSDERYQYTQTEPAKQHRACIL